MKIVVKIVDKLRLIYKMILGERSYAKVKKELISNHGKKIFLFGGLAQAGDILFNPTIKSFESYLLPIYKGKIPIVPSGLKESEAAILGSASLILKEIS